MIIVVPDAAGTVSVLAGRICSPVCRGIINHSPEGCRGVEHLAGNAAVAGFERCEVALESLVVCLDVVDQARELGIRIRSKDWCFVKC